MYIQLFSIIKLLLLIQLYWYVCMYFVSSLNYCPCYPSCLYIRRTIGHHHIKLTTIIVKYQWQTQLVMLAITLRNQLKAGNLKNFWIRTTQTTIPVEVEDVPSIYNPQTGNKNIFLYKWSTTLKRWICELRMHLLVSWDAQEFYNYSTL